MAENGKIKMRMVSFILASMAKRYQINIVQFMEYTLYKSQKKMESDIGVIMAYY